MEKWRIKWIFEPCALALNYKIKSVATHHKLNIIRYTPLINHITRHADAKNNSKHTRSTLNSKYQKHESSSLLYNLPCHYYINIQQCDHNSQFFILVLPVLLLLQWFRHLARACMDHLALEHIWIMEIKSETQRVNAQSNTKSFFYFSLAWALAAAKSNTKL